MTETGHKPWWQRGLLILCLFILLGAAIFGNALNNPFEYDDNIYLVKNHNIRFTENIPRFFVNPRLSHNDPRRAAHYRPLVVTSYAIDYAIGGLNPVGYHVVNLAFHVGAAFLVFLIVKAMLGGGEQAEARSQKSEVRSKKKEDRNQKSGDRVQTQETNGAGFFAGIVASLIFLTHPFNAEAVNYITARSSVMSGFFYLLAFYCWVRYRDVAAGFSLRAKGDMTRNLKVAATPYYLASLVAFILGMLSKEVAITLPVVLWLYDLYFGGRRLKPAATEDNRNPESSRRNLLYWRTWFPYLPFLLVVIIPYMVIRFSKFGVVFPHFQRDIGTQLLTELPVLAKHWQMFLWPGGLSLVHDAEIYQTLAMPVLLSALVLLIYMSAAIYLFRVKQLHWRIVSFFMSWFLIVLLPSTIIPLNAIFQENRGYLAIISFAVLAGVILSELGRFLSLRGVISVVALLMAVYSVLTLQRNIVWGDEVGLWEDTLEKAPFSVFAYEGLSEAYRNRGDLVPAAQVAERGLSIYPENYLLRISLGRAHRLMGKTDQAIEQYEKVLKIAPERATILNELAFLYKKKGDMERAEGYLKKAADVWRDFPPAHYNLGIIFSLRGKASEAIEEFQRAIALYPEYILARYELAKSYERLGRSEDAIREYREIIRSYTAGSEARLFLYGQDPGKVKRVVAETHQRIANKGE